jgi:hypothetical protein
MVKRIIRWTAALLLFAAVAVAVLAGYLRASAIEVHKFDPGWYNTSRDWSEVQAKSFCQEHRWVVVRAEADHLVAPIGPSRAIQLYYASSDPSGDIFLRFGSSWLTSSADLHLLPVYRWSSREHRLIWKALEDHSP